MPAPTVGSTGWGTTLNTYLDTFVAKGSLALNVKDYGAFGNGTADDTTFIQAAINAADAANGGRVFFPPGNYKTTAPLVPHNNVTIAGVSGHAGGIVGASKITNAASHVFTQGSGLLQGFGLENINIQSSAGDVWHEFNLVANLFIHGCYIVVDGTHSVVQCSTAQNFTEGDFSDSWFEQSATSTVPMFYMISTNNAINVNRWRRLRFTYYGTYAIHIENAVGAQAYCYDNLIEDINGEYGPGGIVRLLSCMNTVLNRVVGFDYFAAPGGVSTQDLIYVGKSSVSGGLHSVYTRISNYGRRSGSLGSGLFDIKLQSNMAAFTVIDMCDNATLNGFAVDAGLNTGFSIINCNTTTVTNPPASSAPPQYVGTHGYGGLSANGNFAVATVNGGILTGFTLPVDITVAHMAWYCQTQSGNYDIGLLSATGTVLWAKGSTAVPAATTQSVETVSNVVLSKNTLYWLLISADNTTFAFRGASAWTELSTLSDGTYTSRLAPSTFPIGAGPIAVNGAVVARNCVANFRSV
jgi:hypothetical protein